MHGTPPPNYSELDPTLFGLDPPPWAQADMSLFDMGSDGDVNMWMDAAVSIPDWGQEPRWVIMLVSRVNDADGLFYLRSGGLFPDSVFDMSGMGSYAQVYF